MKPFIALCLASALATACSQPTPEPVIASSASLPGYATTYPAELRQTQTAFTGDEAEARELIRELDGYPAELKEPTWSDVKSVFTLADSEGRSAAYVERFEETETISAFFEEEEPEISKKVHGATQYAAKKKNCDANVGGAAVHSLKKTVEERLEERLRSRSDAHTAIERNVEQLGKDNVETLEKQADAISRASYLAYVGAVRKKLKIRRMIADAEEVKKTLERAEKDLRAIQSAADATDESKETAAEHLELIKASKATIDQDAKAAQKIVEDADARLKKLQEDYGKAFSALIEKIDDEAAKAPADDEAAAGT